MRNLTDNLTRWGRMPYYQAHKSYIIDMDQIHCSYMMELDLEELCDFLKDHKECSELQVYIHWMSIIFCNSNLDTPTFIAMTGVMVAVGIIWVLACILLTYTRIAPCFIAAAHFLHFDEHTSGAIFFAMIAFCTDVLEKVRTFEVNTLTAFNEILGASLTVLTLIGGTILLMHPFTFHPPFLFRDSIFLIGGLSYSVLSYTTRALNLRIALTFMAIYICYLLFIMVEYFIILAMYRHEYNASNLSAADFERERMLPDHRPIQLKFQINSTHEFRELEGANKHIFQQFLRTLNPLRKEVLKQANTFYKCCIIIGMPIYALIILFIPCFDYTLPNYGWSKLIHCFHLVIAGPLLTLLITVEAKYFIYSWIPGFILSVIVFFTSRTDRPPKYHIAFAFFGLAMATAAIYLFQNEMRSIAFNLGLFMKQGRPTNALTVLAWADALSVVVYATRLTEWGYPKIAFAAIYVGPLIGFVCTMGIVYTIKCWESWDYTISGRSGVVGPSAAQFLIFTYIFIVFGVSFSKYQARKSLGYALFIIYVVYLINVYLCEKKIIHGAGSDHSGIDDTGASWA